MLPVLIIYWLNRNASSTSVLSCNNLSSTNNTSQRKLLREPLTPLNTERLDRRHVITKNDIVSKFSIKILLIKINIV